MLPHIAHSTLQTQQFLSSSSIGIFSTDTSPNRKQMGVSRKRIPVRRPTNAYERGEHLKAEANSKGLLASDATERGGQLRWV